jgi:hypothetical protein
MTCRARFVLKGRSCVDILKDLDPECQEQYELNSRERSIRIPRPEYGGEEIPAVCSMGAEAGNRVEESEAIPLVWGPDPVQAGCQPHRTPTATIRSRGIPADTPTSRSERLSGTWSPFLSFPILVYGTIALFSHSVNDNQAEVVTIPLRRSESLRVKFST